MTRFIFGLFALTLAAAASAVPMTMTHSGRLLDSVGGPVEGSHSLTVQLTDSSGGELWSDTFTDVPVQDGYFALVLGSGVALQTQDLSADAVNIGVIVDGGSVQSTMPLSSVPFAIRTEETRNLRGGTVEATTLSASSATIAGVISGESLDVTGAVSSASLSTGGLSAFDISATGLEVSGDTILGDVLSDSLFTGDLEVAGDLEVVGDITAQTLTVGSIDAGEILVDGQSFGGPIVGEWYPSAHRASANNTYQIMTFDRERFNTDSNNAHFTWDGSSTLTFATAGYYRVDMRAISHNNGVGNHFETWKNGSRLHLSHSLTASGTSWRRHATSVVSYFAVGNTLQVRVYCNVSTQTYCYHQGPTYTALTVQLMR
ncbi:MAG: hypothetical protein ACJATT_000478 [Myxococcota bacterium]|jgi:hypothetical protein